MKNLPLYITLLFVLTCAKEDSQDPGTTPSNITPRYTLTASAGEGGSVSPTTGNFNAGTQVSVTATPNSGYTFSGWSNGSSDNPVTVTLNSNTSITANFALIPVYTVTVSAEEGGSVSSEGGDYQEGTQVTITATPDEGYEFSGWSDGSTEATRVITASEDLTLTASFTELIISYTLTVTSQEGGSVNSEGGEYNEGTEVTLTASASEGYRFIGWSDGSTEESITITLSEDTTLEALFELIPIYTVTVTGEGGVVTGEGEYQEGTEVTLTASASEGYRFIGWSDGSTEESITITLTEDNLIEVLFELIPVYTLTVISGEGGVVTGAGEYLEGTEVTITATPDGCYSFTSWSDGNTNTQRTLNINSDQNIAANFESLANNIQYSLVNLTYPCAATISTERSYNETNSYEVGPFGWFSVKMQETHAEWYYPSNTDYHPPGAFSMDPHNFAHGDFNNDGLQDLVITWATFPHTLERESRYNYSIFLNNGDGSMTYDHEAVASSTAHYNHFAYRTKTADFNGDGLDDIVSASMGVIQRLPGQDPYTRWERIPLLLSLGNGRFYDASTNIEGQEDNISPPEGHSYGHELSIGDVDGDGDIDIYTGRTLLLNDGSGSFTNNTELLPEEIKPWGRNLWSSVIADFNNDGIDDFFVPYSETTGASWEQYKDFSGVYSLSKDGKPSYENSYIGFVTEAKYGIGNSKFNYAIDYDINLDGYKDIVIAVTRADPYYVGKGLQVFLNTYDSETGNRKFIAGDNLLPNEGSLDSIHGEGQLSVVDINNDGVLDIAHTSGAYGLDEKGLSFYINNGGSLELFDMNQFAYATQNQLSGKESWPKENTLRRAIPINLDNSGWIDYISYIKPWTDYESSEILLYSVLAKN